MLQFVEQIRSKLSIQICSIARYQFFQLRIETLERILKTSFLAFEIGKQEEKSLLFVPYTFNDRPPPPPRPYRSTDLQRANT